MKITIGDDSYDVGAIVEITEAKPRNNGGRFKLTSMEPKLSPNIERFISQAEMVNIELTDGEKFSTLEDCLFEKLDKLQGSVELIAGWVE